MNNIKTALRIVPVNPRLRYMTAPSFLRSYGLCSHWAFQGDVDHEVMRELLEGILEFGDCHIQRHPQAGGRLEEHPPGHRGTGALGLEFLNVDATLREGMREVTDNPKVIIADQVEREPTAILRRFVSSAAGDRDLESMHSESLQGVDECRRIGIGNTSAQDASELPGQLRHATLQPVAFVGGNDVRQ
jgi:hypothetical protein